MKLFTPASIGLLIFLLIAQVQPASAQIADSVSTWTLQQSVDYAMAHNITIRQQDVTRRFSQLTLKQSQFSQIPSVSASADGGYNLGLGLDPNTNTYVNGTSIFNSNVGVSAGANLFNWFSLRNQIAGNQFEAKANGFLLEKAKNDVALNIAQAFLQILLNDEQVHISQNQLKLTNSQLQNTRKQVDAGAVPESNQADLEAQQARDSSTLVTAQTTAIVSVLQMKALLNLGFDQSYVPQVPGNVADIPMPHLTDLAPEMVFSAAQSTYPLIQADIVRVKEYEKFKRAAYGSMFPTLSINYSLNDAYSRGSISRNTIGSAYENIGKIKTTGDTVQTLFPQLIAGPAYVTPFNDQLNNNLRQYIGLHLSIPILNGWQLRTNYNKAKLNLEAQKLTTDLDNQKLKQDIYTAYANAVGSLQKYNAASRTVEASQRAFDFAGKRYELGLMNTIDYITTQSNLFRAQIDKVSALYDYIFKMKLLEFYRDQHITL